MDTTADTLNSDYGAAFSNAYSDSPYDQIDNGTLTQTATSTTLNNPSWLDSLTSNFGQVANVVKTGTGVIETLTGKTTSAPATVAKSSGTSATQSASFLSRVLSSPWSLMTIAGIGIAAVVVFFMFRSKGR